MFAHEALKAAKPNAVTKARSLSFLLAVAAIFMVSLRADQPGAQKRTSAAEARSHRRATSAKDQAPASQVSAIPPVQQAPKPPDWPANEKPNNAVVEWNSQGLRIHASNSSLEQILKDVSTATGAKVSGLGADERIFGTYGPGPATEVISQLLDGSGYNVLMIGEQGQGTPRQIVLSKQPTGPAPSSGNSSGQSEDNGASSEVDEQPQPPPPPQPQPQPQPQMPPSNPSGFGPSVPQPRTPQQILQEMQQRQRQIEQQQQQQQNNPQ